ncbi:MAG: hypothetical protein OMM_04615 [Candidatus Magnetoglobus multicellularis str. Araruama]|uniref:Fibronectin type-III domain-containing protein n=1 Tax=Candidatus Magnetoglobus multicellularis str. Araruama TaxID=890399 RepID=A0A1V1P0H6_9BACT|nr:MAG: hypothetical protein OMM_04615 [Candidatus Magnetoglobus multicellularis str. Araruama]
MKQGTLILTICMCFAVITVAHAFDNKLMITNVTDTQMTISWRTDNHCTGNVLLSDPKKAIEKTFDDDRGKNFIGDTHYITLSGLSRNTDYFFSILSGDQMDDNNGQRYQASTGSNIIPMGSFQPAGQVLLNDGKTFASNAIVYIVISNETEQSAPLSTLVDAGGYWFLELVNARRVDNEQLFKVSTSDTLSIRIEGGAMGTNEMEYIARDNNGGKNLYSPIVLH